MNKRRRHAARQRRKFPPIFVNAYEVDQLFGGPEEGGWWYDAGTPLASVRVRTEAGIERVKARLRAQLGPQYGLLPDGTPDPDWNNGRPKRRRTSAAGEPDLEVYVEEHPARDFPEVRPHYE